MNFTPTLAFWLEAVAFMGLQVALLAAAAALVQRFVGPPRLHRFLWLAVLAGLAGLLVDSVTGLDRKVAGWFRAAPTPTVRAVMVTEPSVAIGTGPSAVGQGRFGVGLAEGAEGVEATVVPRRAVWWPGWLWMGGAVLVGLRALAPRMWLAWMGWRHRWPAPEEGMRRVRKLGASLGLGRSVRVVTSRYLAGPMAFGVLRPTVGLPADFWRDHTPREQEVMLAHELSHLKGGDPWWLALADTVCAVLWWHPAVWWIRRRFRAACETAADEASLIVEDGPAVLADCLVALAARWRRGGVLGLLGMAGFRSELGRRVQRLLVLRGSDSGRPRPNGSRWLVGIFVTIAVLLTALLPVWGRSAGGDSPPSVWSAMGEALRQWTPKSDQAGAPDDQFGTGHRPSSWVGPRVVEGEVGSVTSALEVDTLAERAALEPPRTLAAEAPSPAGLSVRPGAGGSPGGVAPSAPEATGSGGPEPLLTRTYRFNPHRLAQGFGPVSETNAATRSVAEALGRLFAAAGVGDTGARPAEVYPGIASSEGGTAPRYPVFFWNARTSTLMVRATAKDLEVVEQIVEMVNTEPPQILIEARFVEVTDADARNRGFDWFLGETRAGSGVVTAEGSPSTLTGILSDPQFRAAVTALESSPAGSTKERRGDELDWPGRSATNAANIRVTAVEGPGLQGILNDAQLQVVLRALEARRGTTLLSAPRVVTLSGRQAQIQLAELKTVITGVHPEALRPGAAPVTPLASPFITAQVPVGPVLDIIPEAAADGVTIQLTVMPSVTEFLGYDEPPKDGKVRIWEQGKSRMVEVPLPRFRVRQMQTAVKVMDGQTLVLGGWVTEDPEAGEKGRPRRDGRKVRKQLLVLVTPTLVDPAGNRVHAFGAPAPGP